MAFNEQLKNQMLDRAAKNLQAATKFQQNNRGDAQPIKTAATIKADLTFIFTVRNLLEELNPFLLFDAMGQYNFNTNNSITNEGIEIVGQKKNYQAFRNQLIGNSYKLIAVNFEVNEANQLNNSISIYTNSQDNDAAIFKTSITPSLYKNSGQYLGNLIETEEDLYLDSFSAWTGKLEPLATTTLRVFASYGKSFR